MGNRKIWGYILTHLAFLLIGASLGLWLASVLR